MAAEREPLRVGYVVERFPCASETFVANEIRGVAEQGLRVTVFALTAGGGAMDVPAEVVYAEAPADAGRHGRLRSMPALLAEALAVEGPSPRRVLSALRRAKAVRRFAAEADRRGIRHLHAHFASLPATLAFMTARLTGATVSFAAHARDIYLEPAALPRKLSRATLCVTCSRANAEFLRGLAPQAGRSRVVVVYHGTDLDRFTFRPRTEPASPPLVVAMGRFVPKKGFDVLLRACALLRSRMELRCEIVGEGPLAAHLPSLARRLDLGGTCSFPGWMPYERTPQLYGRADVLAAPSVVAPDGDRDGLPNVVVEAMASGVPVVACRVGSIPEAVLHEQTGLLVPPGDPVALANALERLLTDADLRAAVARAARRRAEEQFDCREGARMLTSLLRK